MTIKCKILLVLVGWAAVLPGQAPVGEFDRIFSAVPFNRWLTEGDQGRFRWTTRVAAAELSSHQRLRTRIEIEVDGDELVARRGHGELVMLIQFQDSMDRVYQTHGIIDLQDVKESAGKSNVQYIQDAFVVPGDYRISMVVFDAKTNEHSTAQKALHVNPLRNDPLPNMWKNLPPVELLHPTEPPDDWFWPDLKGRLHLPAATRRPIRVEVMMNASPSAPGQGMSVGTLNLRSLANLVPALKVFSQVDVSGGSLHVASLDIPKRRVIFEQDAVRQLDWPRLRTALTEADPNKIDVRSLERREQNAQFFVEQVRQRMGAGGAGQSAEEPFRVLIVLSGPTEFSSGEDMRPIQPSGKPNARVYYVRYHLPPERLTLPALFDSPLYRGRRIGAAAPQPAAAIEPIDSLASLLKPLQPRLFDVYFPDQFRKALSTLLMEIEKL